MTEDLIARLRNPPFGTETSERNLMAAAADEIEKLQSTLEKVRRSALTLTETQRQIYDHYQTASKINREAVGTLDSERECNALLTAEVDLLKLDLEAKECLMDSQYIAGVKMGWNLCATEDEAGYAKITGNTEHIAELRRINERRTAFPEPRP